VIFVINTLRVFNQQPALINPMVIPWNHAKWHTPSRLHTRETKQEIERQVTPMLDLGLIRPSQATHYSQVHLVAKPCFGIDFRHLNTATKPLGWSLPHWVDFTTNQT
jgi:hypothetical protein